MNEQYNTIEEAIEDLRAGKIILVTDDPDRENEGDMICAAEFATQENINFITGPDIAGKPCKGSDLYADERGSGGAAGTSADGIREHG